MAQETKTFLEALHDKYSDENFTTDNSFCQIYISASAPRKAESGSLHLPRQLAMDDCNIAAAGDSTEIGELCSSVTELDINKNKLSNWTEVFGIVSSLNKLEFLNIGSNPLKTPEISNIPEMATLKHLVLNNTGVSWTVLEQLLLKTPRLTDLHLSLNSYEDVTLSTQFPNVQSLHFNKNNVTEWSDIRKLGLAFPNLKTLIMCDNQATLSGCENVTDIFPLLEYLSLNESGIKDWDVLETLNELPQLKDFRVQGIPLLQPFSEKERRQFPIAILPKITHLNGSRVREQEREDAERAYIRHYLDKDNKPARYHELEKIHGKLDPLVEIDLKPKDTVYCKVINEDTGSVQMMNIPLNQSVIDLKKFLQSFIGLPPSKYEIFLKDPNVEDDFFRQLNQKSKMLYNMHVYDGCEFMLRAKLNI